MDQVTVQELYDTLGNLIKDGHGNKKLILSDDNEGNGFHGMFYTASEIPEDEYEYFESLLDDSDETDLSNVIIIG